MANSLYPSTVPVPSHVPPGLVFDFDYLDDPGLTLDPHNRIAELIDAAPPVFFTPRNGGHWIAIAHKAVFAAVRMTDLFSSTPAEIGGTRPPLLLPLMIDPPMHASYRLPLNSAFGPQAMARLEGPIRELTRSLVAKVAGEGRCEFVSAVAEPVPVLTFLKLMGLPGERLTEFRTVIKKLATSDGTEGLQMMAQIDAIMMEYIEKRREKPESDLISALWQLQIDGRPITIEEMRNFCILLFIAGLDTVINEMAFAFRHVARNPELQAELRADRSKIPAAIEEALRCYGIVMPPRLVTRDAEFQGVNLRKDERMVLMLPAANLDGEAFDRPLTFDADRATRSHLTFAAGPHRCVGMHLARIEMRVVLEEWLATIPEFRLDPSKPPRFRSGNILSVDALDLIW